MAKLTIDEEISLYEDTLASIRKRIKAIMDSTIMRKGTHNEFVITKEDPTHLPHLRDQEIFYIKRLEELYAIKENKRTFRVYKVR